MMNSTRNSCNPLVLLLLMLFFGQWQNFNYPIEEPKAASSMIHQFLGRIPSLPRYMEGGYSPLGRSPVVDMLLGDPLYLPTYGLEVAAIIKEQAAIGRLYALQGSTMRAAGMALCSQKPMLLGAGEEPPELFLQHFPRDIACRLYSYWQTFTHLHVEVEELLSPLSIVERAWLRENVQTFFFASNQGDAEYDFFTSDNPQPLKFFALAAKIDIAKLAECSCKLSAIADDFDRWRDRFAAVRLAQDFTWQGDHGIAMTISQRSNVTHSSTANFFIDLGGYNTINQHAGGTAEGRPVALHLDLKGHNRYVGGNCVQGSGVLGIGLCYCCGGNNRFEADSFSQGFGFMGAGVLVHRGGSNSYSLKFCGQSVALFGYSLLWNEKGKNQYLAKQGMAQAASSTLGVAFLIDSQGNNSFRSGSPGRGGTREGGIGQGGSTGFRAFPWLNRASFYGGLSFLYLGGGCNSLTTPWLGQGSAYFLGAAIVVAEGDGDQFEAEYDSQGQGLHLAAGLLLKKGEHNSFKGGWGSLGVSGDRSLGMFMAIGGHNSYETKEQGIGTARKPRSVGVFIALGGHNRYDFRALSNGSVQLPQSPNEWPFALFLEVGEASLYPAAIDEWQRGSKSAWGIAPHSLALSVPTLGHNALQEVQRYFHATPRCGYGFDPKEGLAQGSSYRPLPLDGDPQALADELAAANYERRRQIYETLDLQRFQQRIVDPDLSFLFWKADILPEDTLGYAILWALRHRQDVDLTPIARALSSKKIVSPYGRKMAVSLLGTYWRVSDVALLADLMNSDPSSEVRYYAALALAINLADDRQQILAGGLCSDLELVRYAIAKGLMASNNPEALPLVRQLFGDRSFYVRRMAALTAISRHDKSAVAVLLETLSYPTLDLEENYGNNIFKIMTEFLGVDFGRDVSAWRHWWKDASRSFQFPNAE